MLGILDHAVDDQREGLRERERTDPRDQAKAERDGETGIVRSCFRQQTARDVPASGFVEAVFQCRNLSMANLVGELDSRSPERLPWTVTITTPFHPSPFAPIADSRSARRAATSTERVRAAG
jgi:hypothetical protein